jgi:hypothetical protein
MSRSPSSSRQASGFAHPSARWRLVRVRARVRVRVRLVRVRARVKVTVA